MSVRESVRRALASRAELEADAERFDAERTGCTPIAALVDRTRVRAAGVLRAVKVRPRGATQALEAELYDGSGSITLVFLGRRQIAGIEPGRHLVAEGLVSAIEDRRTMYNPHYELRAGE